MANKAFVYKEEEETQEGENVQFRLFIYLFLFFISSNSSFLLLIKCGFMNDLVSECTEESERPTAAHCMHRGATLEGAPKCRCIFYVWVCIIKSVCYNGLFR